MKVSNLCSRLGHHVWGIISGDDEPSCTSAQDDVSQYHGMLEMVAKFSFRARLDHKMTTAESRAPSKPAQACAIVREIYSVVLVSLTFQQVLTGVTGSLGAHVLVSVLAHTTLRVVALVRAANDIEALQRLIHNLQNRELMSCFQPNQERVKVLASSLEEERLGLAESVYEELCQNTVSVVHVRSYHRVLLTYANLHTL